MNRLLYLFLLTGFMAACTGRSTKERQTSGQDHLEAHADSSFTAMFIRTCCGFTGGDGTYSVRLPDGRTVWIFGDTFVGKVYPDLSREKRSPIYIHNSFVVQNGDSLTTLYHHVNGIDASQIIFPTISHDPGKFSEDSVWFWPGDGLIENGKLKVFLSEFIQADTGMWGFRWQGTWLVSYALPGIVQDSLYRIPYGKESGIHFGHAVCETKEYTYVYGNREGKPYAAKYRTGNVNSKWVFYTGADWSPDPKEARPMGDIHVSEQFSISHIRDKYVLVTQEGFLSPDIYSYTSDTPSGPWGNRTFLYSTPIPDSSKTIFTYNALAHPAFIENDELLISYNVNSSQLAEHFRNADIYHPRFIRVPLKMIDPSF
jgi:hypothetical protein